MRANEVLALLEKRHTDDVFYTEVIIDRGARRMDAWAMRKSWANPLVTGYEVKVSRRDFVQDHKVQDYMPYCNEMYLVAPRGVLEIDELPEGCGYLEVASTGTRLFTRKKAAYRECTLSEDFLRSILFSKAEDYYTRLDTPDRALARRLGTYKGFEKFVEDEEELHRVGHTVSRKYSNISRENTRLRYDNERLQNVKEWKDNFEDIFGPRAAHMVEYNSAPDDQLQDIVRRKLDELGNPERKVIELVTELQEELQAFKSALGVPGK